MSRLLLVTTVAGAVSTIACGSSHVIAPDAGKTADAASSSAPSLDASDDADVGAPAKTRPPSPFALRDIVGLSTHTRLGTDAASVNERAFEWAKLFELGIHRIRTDFAWADIEPQRGVFDYAKYDTLVGDATAHGIDVLALLDYGVPWATSTAGADAYYPPDDPRDFGAFAQAVAGHFQNAVHDYEIWNEPNNGLSFWKPSLSGDPAKYGALLLEATKDLLLAQPGANVAYGGTVYNDIVGGPDFVAQSLQATAGLASGLGAFAMHAYEKYPPVSAPESNVEVPLLGKVATMSSVLDDAGAKPVPIWITEIGWPTTAADPLAQQARYTARAVVLGALAGADRVFLYTLEDGPHPTASPPEDAFGLVGYVADWSDASAPADKPAFVALKALLGAVGGYAVTARLPSQVADVYAIELTSANGAKAWVSWRALDGAMPTSVALPASGNVRVTQVDGSTQDGAASGGSYAVQVGPDPVIVTPR